jgi:predicted MFS family arabinose efflux permease
MIFQQFLYPRTGCAAYDGVYRLWRDLGYAAGAVFAGLVADWLGMAAAIHVVAALTLVSGLVILARMRKTLERLR